MKFLDILLRTLFTITIISTPCHSSQNDPPINIVNKYCELDYNGARMSSETYDPIDRLKSKYESGDILEPGWDSFYVISGYRVGKTYTSGNKTIVEVEYDIEGIDSYPHFERFDLTAIERFHLVKVNNEWRVEDIINLPRISIETAIRHYEELIQSYGKQGNTKEVTLLRDKLLRVKDIQQDRIRWPRKVE